MSSLYDDLRQEYTIETPESVSFGYDVAGVGSRFIGALVDLAAVALLLVALNFVGLTLLFAVGGEDVLFSGFEADAGWLAGLVIAMIALVEFAIVWGYFMVFELLWNGQTPGKRLAGTRVVRLDGEPAGFTEVAIRNLVRIVDFLPTAYAVGFVTMLLNDKSRRLGDFAAGTLVVRERTALALADLARPAVKAQAPATQSPSDEDGASDVGDAALAETPVVAEPPASELNLRRMSHDDYALIADALQREAQGRLPYSTLARLAALYAAKLDAPPLARDRMSTRDFLGSLLESWAQQERQ